MNDLWNQLTARVNRTLSDQQQQKLSQYLDLLFEANQTMNLTRIVDRAGAEVQHVGDALTILPHLPEGPILLADVGTGGGVPGIPLAIARPEMQVALIEATQKKAAFLQRTVQALGLTNVIVLPERAEDVGQSKRRETFDVAVARAVATVAWLAEWCLPLVKKGGKVLAMKGPRVHEELPEAKKALRMLGGGQTVLHPVDLPDARGLVILEIPKQFRSDPKYPRPASLAKGNPL